MVVDDYLADRGLTRVGDFDTRHPAFKFGLYVRKPSVTLEQQNEALRKERERSKRIELDRDKFRKLNLEQADRFEKLSAEQSELERSRAQLQTQLKEMEDRGRSHDETLSGLTRLGEQFKANNSDLEAHLLKLSGEAQALAQSQSVIQQLLNSRLIDKLEARSNGGIDYTKDLDYLKAEITKLSTVPATLGDLRFGSLLNARADDGVGRKIWQHQAEMFFLNGRFSQSAEYFQIALDAGGDEAWCTQGLAEAMARAENPPPFWYVPDQKITMDSRGRWDAVVRTYRKALAMDPDISVRFNEAFPSPPIMDNPNAVIDPIFVVGCGHSGTSILLRILGKHKDVWPVRKESALFLRSDANVAKRMALWDEECHAAEKARWVEKTPPNVFQISRLMAARPESKVVLIVRDGRDVVASLKDRVGYADVQDRIDRWLYDNLAAKPFWDHERVHMLKYENLVSGTEKTLKSLCKFLGLPYDKDMVNFHEEKENWYTDELKNPEAITNNDDHNNLRNWQVNQPIFDGRGRWKKDLADSDLRAFMNSCQELMSKLGYSDL